MVTGKNRQVEGLKSLKKDLTKGMKLFIIWMFNKSLCRLFNMKKKSKLIVQKRKLYRFGGSLGILLPREFVKMHGLKEGQEIPVLADHILKIVPMSEEVYTEEDSTQN